jgi:hypothetical protein
MRAFTGLCDRFGCVAKLAKRWPSHKVNANANAKAYCHTNPCANLDPWTHINASGERNTEERKVSGPDAGC